MSVVVDASVALKWVLDEPGSQSAADLRGERLIAPALSLVEAANALWRHAQSGAITTKEAADRLSILRAAPVTTSPIEEDIEAALELASRLPHPVYDCLYLAMAIRETTHVITADQRFHEVVTNSPDFGQAVRLLGSAR